MLAALGVASCGDGPSTAAHPSPGGGRLARVDFVPVFSAAAHAAATRLADFGVTFDRVRVVIVRAPSDTVKDTTIAFAPGQPDVTLDLSVEVRMDNETFGASIDYANASGVVFHGEGTVQAHAPGVSTPPQQIQVTYAGPGANVAHIAVSPKTASVVTPSSIPFTVTGVDANNTPVPNVPVSWSTSDPSIATISNTGLLTTAGKRGTVTVTATTPNNITDNASVTVRLPTAGIELVSGGGQTGTVGATLPQPGVVRVVAADGAVVPGVAVNFAPPTGGEVGSSTVTTDVNGLASTSLTLGGTVGPQSFAAAIGAFSVAIPETATVGDAAVIAAVSGSGQSDTVKHKLTRPFVAKVSDQFGNPVSSVTVSWARTSGSGALSSASSTTGADGQTSVTYTLGSVAGTETVSATITGVSSGATFTAQASAGAPAAIAAVSGDAQTVRIQQTLAPFVAKVTDADGNPVSGFTVEWSATNGTLAAATTTTDATGSTSNTMTVGSTAGQAVATATAGTKSLRFAATVQTGIVSQLAIIAQPPSPSVAGVAMTPAVQVALRDAGGNLVASTNAVTVALNANSTDATLRGTLTRNAVAGIATFDDLTIDQIGEGYTLLVTSPNAGRVTSGPFDVIAPPQPPTLATVTPAQVDAVFTTIPVVLSGSRFVAGATTVSAVGAQITPVNFGLEDTTTLIGNFNIAGGAATATATVTVTTPQGTSTAIPFQVYSVGAAPVQLGAANGGSGGTAYSLDCPAGAVATGLNVRGGSNVDQVQVICQPVTGANRTFGAATTTGTAGGTGGSPAALTCPANSVLTGLSGFVGAGSGGLNDMIAGICTPIGGGQSSITASVGSQFGTSVPYSTSCPAGMVVTGIQGGAGNLVDRTQIKCR